MKKIIFAFYIITIPAFGAAPSTSCPSGYIAINEEHLTIATSCPSGTVSVGTAETCLASSPAGSCIIYAPVGISYTDSSGTYEYAEQPCAMQ